MTFATLVGANLSLIFVSRSRSQTFVTVAARHNRVFWWIVAITLVVLAFALLNPPTAALFHFATPPAPLIVAAPLSAMSCVLLAGLALRTRRSAHKAEG